MRPRPVLGAGGASGLGAPGLDARSAESNARAPPARARRAPRGRGGGARARIHSKVSFGIILVRIDPATRCPQAVLGRGRCSYAFVDFVHGRYDPTNLGEVQELIDEMTIEEKLDLRACSFDLLWYRVWLEAKKADLFQRKRAKFVGAWIRDDGGDALRRMIARSRDLGRPRWEVPKGRRRSNREANVQCATREFYEETGVQKDDYQILTSFRRQIEHIHRGVRYVYVYYVAIPRRDIQPSVSLQTTAQASEICELRWMNLSEIRLVDGPERRLESTVVPAFRYVKNYHRSGSAAGGVSDLRIPPETLIRWPAESGERTSPRQRPLRVAEAGSTSCAALVAAWSAGGRSRGPAGVQPLAGEVS